MKEENTLRVYEKKIWVQNYIREDVAPQCPGTNTPLPNQQSPSIID